MSKANQNVPLAATSPFEKRLKLRGNLALGGAGFLILAGVIILVFALFRFIAERRGIGLVAPGCSLIAAGIASGVATLGIVSWAEQRERDREAKEYEHREKFYENIAQFMVARFIGAGYDKQLDAQLRTIAALWASPTVLTCLAQWQQTLSEVMDRSSVASVDAAGTPSRNMTDADSALVKRKLAPALIAMRQDLASISSTDVDPLVVLRSIFNEDIPDDLFAMDGSDTK